MSDLQRSFSPGKIVAANPTISYPQRSQNQHLTHFSNTNPHKLQKSAQNLFEPFLHALAHTGSTKEHAISANVRSQIAASQGLRCRAVRDLNKNPDDDGVQAERDAENRGDKTQKSDARGVPALLGLHGEDGSADGQNKTDDGEPQVVGAIKNKRDDSEHEARNRPPPLGLLGNRFVRRPAGARIRPPAGTKVRSGARLLRRAVCFTPARAETKTKPKLVPVPGTSNGLSLSSSISPSLMRLMWRPPLRKHVTPSI